VKRLPAPQVISQSQISGLIIKCGLFFTVGLILTGVVLYFSAHQPLGPSYQESFTRLSQLKQEMLLKSLVIYCILVALITAGVVFVTILYSHRVVGPMVGLKRILGQVSAKNLSQSASLREKDAIKPMADALNEMIDTYKKKIVEMEKTVNEMENTLDALDETDRVKKVSAQSSDLEGILKTLQL